MKTKFSHLKSRITEGEEVDIENTKTSRYVEDFMRDWKVIFCTAHMP